MIHPGLKFAATLALASVCGYGVIAVVTILGFNVWLDGIQFYGAGPLRLGQAGLVLLVAGGAGGALAALIGGARPLAHGLGVWVFIALDTGYVVFFFEDPAPWWFHLLGGLTLMATTLAGALLVARRHSVQRRP